MEKREDAGGRRNKDVMGGRAKMKWIGTAEEESS